MKERFRGLEYLSKHFTSYLLKDVKDSPIVVVRYSKPLAAVIAYSDYMEYKKYLEEKDLTSSGV